MHPHPLLKAPGFIPYNIYFFNFAQSGKQLRDFFSFIFSLFIAESLTTYYPQILNQDLKGWPRTNAPAYLASLSVTEKSFSTLELGVQPQPQQR
jgi:hypothetical protein